MSDAVLIQLIISVFGTVTVVFVAWLNLKQGKRIEKIDSKVDTTDKKIDEYHKAVNGNMEKLLVTTEALGKATGKEQEKQDQAKRNKGK